MMQSKILLLALTVCIFATLPCKGENHAKEVRDKPFLVLPTRNSFQCFNLCWGTKPCKRITFNVKTKECSLLDNKPDLTTDSQPDEPSRRQLIIKSMPESDEKRDQQEKKHQQEHPTNNSMYGMRPYFQYKSSQFGCTKRPCEDYEMCSLENSKHHCLMTGHLIESSATINDVTNSAPSSIFSLTAKTNSPPGQIPKDVNATSPCQNVTHGTNTTHYSNTTLESNETSIHRANQSTNVSSTYQPTTETASEESTSNSLPHNHVSTQENNPTATVLETAQDSVTNTTNNRSTDIYEELDYNYRY